jgi:hypothetical protein
MHACSHCAHPPASLRPPVMQCGRIAVNDIHVIVVVVVAFSVISLARVSLTSAWVSCHNDRNRDAEDKNHRANDNHDKHESGHLEWVAGARVYVSVCVCACVCVCVCVCARARASMCSDGGDDDDSGGGGGGGGGGGAQRQSGRTLAVSPPPEALVDTVVVAWLTTASVVPRKLMLRVVSAVPLATPSCAPRTDWYSPTVFTLNVSTNSKPAGVGTRATDG